MMDLKPCPFCGTAAVYYDAEDKTHARCPDEDCAGRVSWMPVDKWNCRPVAPSPSPAPLDLKPIIEYTTDHRYDIPGVARTFLMDLLAEVERLRAAPSPSSSPAPAPVREAVAAEIVLCWQKFHAYRGKIRFADFSDEDKRDFYEMADRVLAVIPPAEGSLLQGGGDLREKLVEATDLMDKLRYMVNMGCMHGETLKRVDAFLEAVCAAPAPTPAQGGEA